MRSLKSALRRLLPSSVLSLYHLSLAYLGALLYGFPSHSLTVIGVTGTNGKSSTVEFVNAIFEAAGRTTALSSSIRVKVAGASDTATGRSMPGRFFIQRFLRRACRAGCTVAIIEMTSEGVKQHRHRAIALDALVFLNLAPEHIESHGSLEKYADAKFQLGVQLARSKKRPRIMVANKDDAQGERYLALPVEKALGFSLQSSQWHSDQHGGSLRFDSTDIQVRLPGSFYVANALAAATLASAFGIGTKDIQRGIESVAHIPGRMEAVDLGQPFSVVIDYALTPDALEALYKTYGDRPKVCVFGSAGGGRDRWKRPVLGRIAEEHCDTVILTNDIAYDEEPRQIIDDIAHDMKKKPEIIPDRRAAIRRALEIAAAHPDPSSVAVLVTGMGIDSEITSGSGATVPWNDVQAVREELQKLLEGRDILSL